MMVKNGKTDIIFECLPKNCIEQFLDNMQYKFLDMSDKEKLDADEIFEYMILATMIDGLLDYWHRTKDKNAKNNRGFVQ